MAYFTGRPDRPPPRDTQILHSQEYHTSYWGHLGLLGLRDHVLLPTYAAYVKTAAASLFPDNAAIADLAHEQGGRGGLRPSLRRGPGPDKGRLTPDRQGFGPASPSARSTWLWGRWTTTRWWASSTTPRRSAEVWYRLLNCGFRIPAGAGTDAMANYASLRGPVGLNRAFAKVDGPPDEATFLAAVQGRPHLRHQRAAARVLPGGQGHRRRGRSARGSAAAGGQGRSCGRSSPSTISRSWATARWWPRSRSRGDRTSADATLPVTVLARPAGTRCARAPRARVIPCSTGTPSRPRARST